MIFGNGVNLIYVFCVILSIVVSDSFVDKTIKAITDSGATGEIGDGKIFLYNCEEAYRIRTGETGNQSFN